MFSFSAQLQEIIGILFMRVIRGSVKRAETEHISREIFYYITFNDAESNQMASDFRDVNLKIQDARLLNDWAIAW